MERGGRISCESHGVMIKKRSSYGCLIVKKSDGVGRICSFSESLNMEPWMEKKMSTVMSSDSESSNEHVMPYRNSHEQNTRHSRNDEDSHFSRRRDWVERKGDSFVGKDIRRNILDNHGDKDNDDKESEYAFMKRRGPDKLCFDREYKTGPSKNLVPEKRRKKYVDGFSDTDFANQGYKNRCKLSLNETKPHVSMVQKKCKRDMHFDGPIRVQGKNGVLKVMQKKNKMGLLLQNCTDAEAKQTQYGSKIQDTGKIRVAIQSTTLKTENIAKLLPPVRIHSNEIPMALPMKSKGQDQDSEDSDISGQLRKRIIHSHTLLQMSGTRGGNTSPEDPTQPKIRDGKIRRGSGTEKQRLRERIREMLLEAGWTIDYRPRRNRDYLDAVYISPKGTAYWSIIKAYEALLKQVKSGEKMAKTFENSAAFTLISDEILSQLTRRTKRKIEKDMKMHDQCVTDSDGRARNFSDSRNDVENDEKYVHRENQSPSLVNVAMLMKNDVNHRDGSPETTSKSQIPLHNQTEKSTGYSSHHVNGGKSSKPGRSTLLVRPSTAGNNAESNGCVYGKRTVLAWLLDSGIVQLKEKVMYMNQRRTLAMLEGWITGDGIHCGCCGKILSVSKFEIHAGSKLKQPFQNIFLDSGVSLFQCQIDAWDKQKGVGDIDFCLVDVIADDPNDDACGICGDGGDLVCCDSCPSAFHQRCLGIQMFPLGDWHCPNCICKFCRRVVEDTTQTVGANTCIMCEKKYHKSCMHEANVTPADTTESITSFCGKKCKALSEGLKKYVDVQHELEDGFSWSIVHRANTNSELLLGGHHHDVENNSKLAIALTVMDECFFPITDQRSGVNIVRNVLYNSGSNINRLNFGGFYTALLERGDEIVASASIRFHGNRLAEMPFIGTRHVYRHQGMCRRLFGVVESILQQLKVKLLIIPATDEFSHIWMDKFGFHPIKDSLTKELQFMNLLAFPGINMLQKELLLRNHITSDVDTCQHTEIKSCQLSPEGQENIDSPIKTTFLETTVPSGDKLISDSVTEHNLFEDLNSVSQDGLVPGSSPIYDDTSLTDDRYPEMEETKFKTSTMASDVNKNIDCRSSFSPFEEEEEEVLLESVDRQNCDMAFLDQIIRSPVETGESGNEVVFGSVSPARQ